MNQYRCETCTKRECWMHPIHEEEIMVKGTALVDPQEFCSIHKHTEQRGCASHSNFQSERETATGGWKRYRCNSDTCSDSGGVCILCIPDMDFAPPTSCVNPEAFTDNGDEPDCEWEELRYQAGERE
jgi:hypothetical protein